MVTRQIVGAALFVTLVATSQPAGKGAPMKPTATAGAPATSVLLKEVPWVGFYQGSKKGNPEDHPLPSVMRALMEYTGSDLGLPGFVDQRGKWRWSACALFHGVTGSGFAFNWKQPYGEGHLGRALVHSYDRAFVAAGLSRQMLLRSSFAATYDHAGRVSDDAVEYRRLIVQSIRDRRLPVIAIGVIGPEEPCLISGFQDEGEVIVGWNFFLDEARKDPRVSFDAEGRFVMRDWFRDTHAIAVPGAPLAPPPDRRDLRVQALRQNLALLCNCGSDDAPFGSAAYQAWIEYLLAPIPDPVAADPRQIKPLHAKHNEPVGELAERRAYAASFLEHAVKELPAVAKELQRARYCHQAMHDILWRVWQTVGVWHKTDDAKLLRFADPAFRTELASLVRRLQAWDLESAKHIREALAKLGVADLPALPALKPITGLRDLGVEHPLPGQLDRLWETPEPAIPGVPAPQGPGLADAIRAATAVTDWPIDAPANAMADLRAWGEKAGWQLRIVNVSPDEQTLPRARRINDVILSCLYGLPVATTHDGKPVVVTGYNHLAGETLRVRLPDQADDAPAAKIRMDDKGWGPTWVFLAGRK
ncbi:MAG: hypothetical protein HN380_20745 [Victivallales bacterium]|nr:hypothetical protein [Victivallales bacterium]